MIMIHAQFKKIVCYPRLAVFCVILILFMMNQAAFPQVVNQATKKKISIGVGLFTDLWLNMPSGIKSRTINQGVNLFVLYNLPFGKSDFGFSAGLGLSVHNCYGNFLVDNRNDTVHLLKIPDTTSYKRSKITLTYLEVPIEFHFKSKSKVSVGLGFKGGFLVGSSTKYVGNGNIPGLNYTVYSNEKIRIKFWGIKNLEQFTYGPTLRIGYKWANFYGYYMLSSVFTRNHGPDMYPISLGFVLMPF